MLPLSCSALVGVGEPEADVKEEREREAHVEDLKMQTNRMIDAELTMIKRALGTTTGGSRPCTRSTIGWRSFRDRGTEFLAKPSRSFKNSGSRTIKNDEYMGHCI